jgi:hypothetical protein
MLAVCVCRHPPPHSSPPGRRCTWAPQTHTSTYTMLYMLKAYMYPHIPTKVSLAYVYIYVCIYAGHTHVCMQAPTATLVTAGDAIAHSAQVYTSSMYTHIYIFTYVYAGYTNGVCRHPPPHLSPLAMHLRTASSSSTWGLKSLYIYEVYM